MKKPITLLALLLLVESYALGGESIQIKWRFPVGNLYKYEFKQVMVADIDFERIGDKLDGGPKKNSMIADGEILIKCAGDRGTVEFNIQSTEIVLAGRKIPNEELEKMPPLRVSMPILPDGKIQQGRYGAGGNVQLMFDLLFPIPHLPIAIGEELKQEMVMFSSGGLTNLEGVATYIYKGNQYLKGINTAEYHVLCDLSTDPGDKTQMGKASLKSEIVCLFAIDKGYFISVKSKTKMIMESRFPREEGKMKMVQHHDTNLELVSAE